MPAVLSEPTATQSLEGDFKAAFRHHPGGVAVVTAQGPSGPVALTATSVASASLKPPMLVFSVAHTASGAAALVSVDSLVVHLVDSGGLDVAQRCATSGSDRFGDRSSWSRLPTGEPYFTSLRTWLRGAVRQRMTVGEATLIAVEVLEVRYSAEGVSTAPVVYHNRAWHVLPQDAPRRTDAPRPLAAPLETRWSPRSFDHEASISDAQLSNLLQAARWAPSASNHQPRRFIVGRRGTQTFRLVEEHLMGFNSRWASRASALVVALAESETADGEQRRWAEYDLGQAMAALTVQSHHEGFHVHQMGGIEVDGLRAAFGLPERLVPVTVSAIGVLGDPSQLDERSAARELRPRTRLPLEELVLRCE